MTASDVFRGMSVIFALMIVWYEVANLQCEVPRWKFIKVLKIVVSAYLVFVYVGLFLRLPQAAELSRSLQSGIMTIILLTWFASILRDKVNRHK